ncbi:fluoride efflux transporter FluC [Apilactobacillus xinyiensis]|uniref:fluoride efflux transporter FluC n=1 Tax=Apilactobacillus xinyiensis TaxID=2841032 RepID=UPI00200F100C|nr:CrcB family protein [Apilactobacillus xinyiensis]MCL0330705.1 CrcB family protein [Apilactobacillus xinyiensis]
MRKVIFIFIFAFIGGAVRGLLSYLNIVNIFVTIALINILGSFLLAFITGLSTKSMKIPSDVLVAISTGLIGGFTTFSTFSVQFINLLEHHEIGLAFTYLIFSLGLGLISAVIGYDVGCKFLNKKEVK